LAWVIRFNKFSKFVKPNGPAKPQLNLDYPAILAGTQQIKTKLAASLCKSFRSPLQSSSRLVKKADLLKQHLQKGENGCQVCISHKFQSSHPSTLSIFEESI
jgi:hypothetical protein